MKLGEPVVNRESAATLLPFHLAGQQGPRALQVRPGALRVRNDARAVPKAADSGGLGSGTAVAVEPGRPAVLPCGRAGTWTNYGGS